MAWQPPSINISANTNPYNVSANPNPYNITITPSKFMVVTETTNAIPVDPPTLPPLRDEPKTGLTVQYVKDETVPYGYIRLEVKRKHDAYGYLNLDPYPRIYWMSSSTYSHLNHVAGEADANLSGKIPGFGMHLSDVSGTYPLDDPDRHHVHTDMVTDLGERMVASATDGVAIPEYEQVIQEFIDEVKRLERIVQGAHHSIDTIDIKGL